MARSRNIKPGFFKNEDLAELGPLAQLLFAGLWTLADKDGRLEDRPKRIKAEIFPYYDCAIDDLLTALHDSCFIQRYVMHGLSLIQVRNWKRHQNPHHKEVESVFPAPEIVKTSTKSDSNSCLSQAQTKHESSMDQASVIKNVSTPLIPDSLNLIPDSLNSDSLKKIKPLSGNANAKPDVPVYNFSVDNFDLVPEKPPEKKPPKITTAHTREVLGFFNEVTGGNFQEVEANLTLIGRRLVEALKYYNNVDSACLLARRICIDRNARWSADDKMSEYLRPATLFAKENFWNYAGQLPDNLKVLKPDDEKQDHG